MAMNLSTHQDRPSRRSVAELSDVNKVTVPVIVYVALVVGVFIFFLALHTHINRHDIH